MQTKFFTYNEYKHQLAIQAKNATSNVELAQICQQLDIAEVICLGSIDLWFAKKALSAVYGSLKMLPALRSVINYFGTYSGFMMNYEALFNSLYPNASQHMRAHMKQRTEEMMKGIARSFNANGLAVAFMLYCDDVGFSGIIFNGNTLKEANLERDLAYGESVGFCPVKCGSIKGAIEHEIGHLADYLLDISSDKEFLAYINRFCLNQIGNNLSSYCVANDDVVHMEVVAECYSECCNNPEPREIASTVRKIILKKYIDKFAK